MQLSHGRLRLDRAFVTLAASIALLVLGGCASSDEGSFDPGTGGSGGSAGTDGGSKDAASDAKSDAATCNLAACPTPPGGAQKCCAAANACGYLGGSICYPLKDGGAGGAAGSSP